MRLPGVTYPSSHTYSEPDDLPAAPYTSWQQANDEGLALAAGHRWAEAVAAFSEAIALAPAPGDAPDTHALLLSNQAQALYQVGEHDAAIDLARRSLSARLVCCDSDGDAPMARARADLAVYLAANGELEEAESMLRVARMSLEHAYGDEDARLAGILENQARVALMMQQPAVAEPALLRLHALLAEAGADPSRLQPLFALVAEYREHADMSDDVSIFPDLSDDGLELIVEEPHSPLQSPSAQAIRDEGLVEPGEHPTPDAYAQTNPLGFVVQYGVPQESERDQYLPPRWP
jgi:tetratricopeptide (TPR) repeat protein